MNCGFCESYNGWLYANSVCSTKDLEHKITVAIVNGTYRKNRKTIQSRNTDYNNKGRGFELNYCPSCGKELRGEK